MSVFTDTQNSHWPGFIGGTSPFGWDSLHSGSSPFRGLRSGLGLFDNDHRDNDDTKPSKMRLRSTGPTALGQRGFCEHFDNVFHDHRRCDAANAESSKRGQSSESTGRGKEYVIPIKIERVSSSSDNSKPNTRSASATVAKSSSSSAKATSASSTSSRPGTIEIPIIRETSDSPRKAVNRSGATGRDNKPAFSVPSTHFKLLTPTTEQGHRGIHDSPSKNGDIVYMDYEDFFPSKSQNSDNCDVIEIEEEDDETVTTTRRKSPRHSSNAASAAVTSKKPAPSSRTESTSSPQSSASSSNIRSAENVTIIDIKSPERSREAVVKEAAAPASQERRKGVCSAGSSGTIEVTPTPSYPVYDLLKPRLASIERQLDYIRGDGNCFFRALSKEMYGSEDFHAEWRQAVVDVIESHPHVFRQYIDGENVQEHVAEMRRAGTWATTCEIYAAATLLQREIYVLAPNPTGHEYNWLLFSPRALPGASSSSSTHQSTATSSSHGQAAEVHPCYLTLCYTNGNHYDRITPVFARCNCEMAPPSLSGLSLLVDLTDEDGRKVEIK